MLNKISQAEVIMFHTRRSGILLHPTSLPGPGGIGSLGEAARGFVDFLAAAGQSLWQVLPLTPTGHGNSPYSSFSAFAGNWMLIDLTSVVAEGDLMAAELTDEGSDEWVDYDAVGPCKSKLLRQAADRFLTSGSRERKEDFWHFCDTTPWLHDFALFMALKEEFHYKSWATWPTDIAGRGSEALREYSESLGPAIGRQKYMQWQFSRQWLRLKQYANGKGIAIIGDVPIFVAYDSTDVWCNRQLFHLDEKGKPLVVAGVPPDYFSRTGQLWGNPLYDWTRQAADGYSWWRERIRNDLTLYDFVRIDHFRGFEAYWEVSAQETTAINGRWVKGPGEHFFQTLQGGLGPLPVIAEDLGVITPEVEALRDRFSFPGMKILQFAFGGGADNPYLPHNYRRKGVVYTGTHDNDTTLGWFSSLPQREKKQVLAYVNSDGKDIVWDLVRAAQASVADMAMIPLQDILGLDSSARMNIPGKAHGNWTWRYSTDALDPSSALRLRTLVELYGRLPVGMGNSC